MKHSRLTGARRADALGLGKRRDEHHDLTTFTVATAAIADCAACAFLCISVVQITPGDFPVFYNTQLVKTDNARW